MLGKRYYLLSKVKNYIDVYLDPRKVNILDSEKQNFEKPKEFFDILEELEIAENDYYHALSISTDIYYQIHFKRPISSCFLNNYFSESLMAWKANIDIQAVINHYKTVAYMCAYFSKSEDESSEAMKQAAKDVTAMNLNGSEQMKSISKAYYTKSECSVQEAVYHVIPVLIFADSNLPEHRNIICRNEDEIK